MQSGREEILFVDAFAHGESDRAIGIGALIFFSAMGPCGRSFSVAIWIKKEIFIQSILRLAHSSPSFMRRESSTTTTQVPGCSL
jgi:hypothetical protein